MGEKQRNRRKKDIVRERKQQSNNGRYDEREEDGDRGREIKREVERHRKIHNDRDRG